MADNDLAFGRLVEALSHSPFWREMAIFAIEDDPQNGFDHVSGYRTTAYVASPYAKRGAVVSTQYNTSSLLRTLDLPELKTASIESPSPFAPLGAKGMGEGGGAAIHAICAAIPPIA